MDFDEEEAVILLLALENVQSKIKPERKYAVHSIIRGRSKHGEYHNLLPELKEDLSKFFEYCTKTTFYPKKG